MADTQRALANWNGEICPLDELRVPVLDRSFFFGDAVYEGIRAYHGKAWLLPKHMERFGRSLAGLKISTDLHRFEDRLQKTLERSGILEAILYCQVSRGAAKRTHAFPQPAPVPNELIYVEPLVSDPFGAFRASGIAAITQPDWRWKRRDLKTVNLLPNCLAKQAAQEAGCQEAILVESDGMITEATASNVAIVRGGRLQTAPLSHRILPGVTRDFVLSMAHDLGIAVEEKDFDKAALTGAEEVFLTGTTTEVLPVTRIDGKSVGRGTPGPLTMRLVQEFQRRVERFAS